ncbi:probable E3 ubiquitin-protein ligase RNF217 [Juglans microcarpa x Juglans regia]|uniref:probable E3 ubiquitin-protein ligase RNF217 n=1 Tax=Juglans microcarpa x Juglans regia TaxID=2249226 RepID=UPI001B7EF965|nr:probable E3 ubiquitin-protein ligase RNF217 [Juglans microcarpa x Juglans regia]
MAKELASDLVYVDDVYFFLVSDGEQENDVTFTVSDEQYAEELQFQEVLMGSLITSQMANKEASSSSSSPEIQATPPTPNAEPVEGTEEAGESSQYCICEICDEKRRSDEMFRNESCVHSFCSDCIGKHVATKIQEGITVVYCPGLDCKAVLEHDACGPLLPKDVLERWEVAQCEALIPASQKFYCPFCSAMLVNDGDEGEVIRQSECPFCHRLFCAHCNVPWHPGVDCEEFQRLDENERGRNDLLVRELARDRKWMKCPNCNYIVERTEGCLHIICRCGFQFCYGCGIQWTDDHGGCRRD